MLFDCVGNIPGIGCLRSKLESPTSLLGKPAVRTTLVVGALAHVHHPVPSALLLPGMELLTVVLQWAPPCVCEQSLVLGEVLRLALLSEEPSDTQLI